MSYGRGHERGTRKVKAPKGEKARLEAMGKQIAASLAATPKADLLKFKA